MRYIVWTVAGLVGGLFLLMATGIFAIPLLLVPLLLYIVPHTYLKRYVMPTIVCGIGMFLVVWFVVQEEFDIMLAVVTTGAYGLPLLLVSFLLYCIPVRPLRLYLLPLIAGGLAIGLLILMLWTPILTQALEIATRTVLPELTLQMEKLITSGEYKMPLGIVALGLLVSLHQYLLPCWPRELQLEAQVMKEVQALASPYFRSVRTLPLEEQRQHYAALKTEFNKVIDRQLAKHLPS